MVATELAHDQNRGNGRPDGDHDQADWHGQRDQQMHGLAVDRDCDQAQHADRAVDGLLHHVPFEQSPKGLGARDMLDGDLAQRLEVATLLDILLGRFRVAHLVASQGDAEQSNDQSDDRIGRPYPHRQERAQEEFASRSSL